MPAWELPAQGADRGYNYCCFLCVIKGVVGGLVKEFFSQSFFFFFFLLPCQYALKCSVYLHLTQNHRRLLFESTLKINPFQHRSQRGTFETLHIARSCCQREPLNLVLAPPPNFSEVYHASSILPDQERGHLQILLHDGWTCQAQTSISCYKKVSRV